MKSGTTLRRDLRFSSLDNFLFSVMVGAGETFLPAFVLAMGLSEITAGLITALPFLIGSALQLAAPRGLRYVGSYRRWLVTLGLMQAASFLPLAFVALQGKGVSAGLMYLVVTLYWFCGLASGPAWSSWMSALVPSKVRPQYFSRRSHMGQFGLLFGLLSGGLLLHFAKQGGWEVSAFAGLFLLSGLFRAASAFCLARQSESPRMIRVQRRVTLPDLVARMRSGRDGRLIGFLLIFAAAVNLSAPFFNPFMLKQLHLSYGPYMVLIAASFVAKIVAFSALAKAAKKMCPFRLMRIGIIGTGFLPMLWVLSSDFFYLIFVHVATGAAWAIYDLGVTLALFGAIRDEERTSFLSLYNFASALMIALGTALGGKLLGILGQSSSTYFLIFALSCVLRLLSVIYFDQVLTTPEEPRVRSTPEPVGARPELIEGAISRAEVPDRRSSRTSGVETAG